MKNKKKAQNKKPPRQKLQPAKSLVEFDKYDYYRRSVQSPEVDVVFFQDTFQEIKKRKAKIFREDFCGTFSICCEWVKLDQSNESYGLDLDPEPLAYGREKYLSSLSDEQKRRIHVQQMNVMDEAAPRADIIAASNFSYFIFKQRSQLFNYFRNSYVTLNEGGLFIIDAFGGSHCQEANEEEIVHKDFSYFWDQDNFDPVTNHALFYIHFKRRGEKKREKVFTYDWRMWAIPELRDLLEEVGFKKVHIYWEGTTADGEGDGVFRPVTSGEECQAWVAYLIGEK